MKKGKLSDLCIVIAGQSPQGSAYNDKGVGIEFHQGKKAFGESYLTPSNVWTTEVTKIAEPLDILMSVRAPVGPTNITDRRICIGRGLAAIRCKDGVLQKFILYALRNIESKIVGNDGAVFNSINKAQIEALPVPIISLPEQERIVSLLDAEFAKIDAIKANAEKQLQDAKALFQSALKDYLTPKEGWEEVLLKDIANYRRGSFPQPYGNKEWYDGVDAMPFIQVAELQENDFDLVYPTSRQISKIAQDYSVFVPSGTVLISLQGSIGKVAITQYDCYVDRTIAIFKNFKRDIVKEFFAYQIKLKFAIEATKARGTTIKTITKEEFANFTIRIAPIGEQKKIIQTIAVIHETFKKLQSNFDTTVTLCNDLKQSILKDIFG